jgi:hypothetical protein
VSNLPSLSSLDLPIFGALSMLSTPESDSGLQRDPLFFPSLSRRTGMTELTDQ